MSVSQAARKIKSGLYSDPPELPALPFLEQQGGRVTCYIPQPQDDHKGGGLRGEIYGRSDASRRRLMNTFASIDWALYASALFLGLSFPDPMPPMAKRKRMLLALRAWIERRYPSVPMCWVMEYGRRTGRFHYHLLILQTERIPIKELEAEWCRLGGGTWDGKGNSVDIDDAPSERVARYLSKYCSKAAGQRIERKKRATAPAGGPPCEGAGGTAGADAPLGLSTAHIYTEEEQIQEKTGRTWGWWNVKSLRMAPVVSQELPERDTKRAAARVRRVFAGWLNANRRKSELKLRNTAILDRELAALFADKYGGRPSQYRFMGHLAPMSISECHEKGREILDNSKQYTKNQIKAAFQLLRVRSHKTLPNHLRRGGGGSFTLYVPTGISLARVCSLFVEEVDQDGVCQDKSGYSAWAQTHLKG